MKYLFILLAFYVTVNADKVIKKTLACPTIDKLKKAPTDSNSLDLSLYIIANDCVVLFKDSEISAIGYDPRNATEIFQKILEKKSGQILYTPSSSISVEQDGKKAVLRF